MRLFSPSRTMPFSTSIALERMCSPGHIGYMSNLKVPGLVRVSQELLMAAELLKQSTELMESGTCRSAIRVVDNMNLRHPYSFGSCQDSCRVPQVA